LIGKVDRWTCGLDYIRFYFLEPNMQRLEVRRWSHTLCCVVLAHMTVAMQLDLATAWLHQMQCMYSPTRDVYVHTFLARSCSSSACSARLLADFCHFYSWSRVFFFFFFFPLLLRLAPRRLSLPTYPPTLRTLVRLAVLSLRVSSIPLMRVATYTMRGNG